MSACRFGWTEYDGARYCHEHGDFLEPGVQSRLCTTARACVDRLHTTPTSGAVVAARETEEN